MGKLLIRNARVVTDSEVKENCDLLVENGRIESIGLIEEDVDAITIDGTDKTVLPGIIDLHTDALEAEITPRPGANFPLEVALQEIDSKMLCCGITTVYHSLHLGYDVATLKSKSKYSREEIFRATREHGKRRARANSKIHLRFEIVGIKVVDTLDRLLEEGLVDLLSFMDHTPGQGQYPKEEFLKRRVEEGVSREDAIADLVRMQARPRVDSSQLQRIARKASELDIPIASHDDDSAEKVVENHKLGIGIGEFPITLEAARKAKELGMWVLGGASNVLRGGSLSGNLCMAEAIEAGALDGLCSDYYPPSIVHAIFALSEKGTLPLVEAVRLATLNPARAARIDRYTGSLERGKDADIIVLEIAEGRPRVCNTIVQGRLAYNSPAKRQAHEYRKASASQPDYAVSQ